MDGPFWSVAKPEKDSPLSLTNTQEHRLFRSRDIPYRSVDTFPLNQRSLPNRTHFAIPAALDDMSSNIEEASQNLRGQNFSGSNFGRENVPRSNFSGENAPGSNFSGGNMPGPNVKGENFTGHNVTRSDFSSENVGPNFRGENVTGPNFRGENVTGPNFRDENVTGPNFRGENVTGPNFRGENVTGPNFRGENVTGPNFRGENVTGPNFRGENVTGPNLRGENVTGPNFRGVDGEGRSGRNDNRNDLSQGNRAVYSSPQPTDGRGRSPSFDNSDSYMCDRDKEDFRALVERQQSNRDPSSSTDNGQRYGIQGAPSRGPNPSGLQSLLTLNIKNADVSQTLTSNNIRGMTPSSDSNQRQGQENRVQPGPRNDAGRDNDRPVGPPRGNAWNEEMDSGRPVGPPISNTQNVGRDSGRPVGPPTSDAWNAGRDSGRPVGPPRSDTWNAGRDSGRPVGPPRNDAWNAGRDSGRPPHSQGNVVPRSGPGGRERNNNNKYPGKRGEVNVKTPRMTGKWTSPPGNDGKRNDEKENFRAAKRPRVNEVKKQEADESNPPATIIDTPLMDLDPAKRKLLDQIAQGSSLHQLELIKNIGISAKFGNRFFEPWKCYICGVKTMKWQRYVSHCTSQSHTTEVVKLEQPFQNAGRLRLENTLRGLPYKFEAGYVANASNVLKGTKFEELCECKPCGRQFKGKDFMKWHEDSASHNKRLQFLRNQFGESWQDFIWYAQTDPDDRSDREPAGLSFVVPISGYYCKICTRFYSKETQAKDIHCRQLNHIMKVQNYDKQKGNPAALAIKLNVEATKLEQAVKQSDSKRYTVEVPKKKPGQKRGAGDDQEVYMITDSEDDSEDESKEESEQSSAKKLSEETDKGDGNKNALGKPFVIKGPLTLMKGELTEEEVQIIVTAKEDEKIAEECKERVKLAKEQMKNKNLVKEKDGKERKLPKENEEHIRKLAKETAEKERKLAKENEKVYVIDGEDKESGKDDRNDTGQKRGQADDKKRVEESGSDGKNPVKGSQSEKDRMEREKLQKEKKEWLKEKKEHEEREKRLQERLSQEMKENRSTRQVQERKDIEQRREREKKELAEKARKQRQRWERDEKVDQQKENMERKEQERIERERKEQERIERERLERERLERVRLEKERMEKERKERERLERVRIERVRIERVRIEKERIEREIKERGRLERVRTERVRIEKERIERERIERERLEGERKERERIERVRIEKERIEKERKERERLEREKERQRKKKEESDKREREERDRKFRQAKEQLERQKKQQEQGEREFKMKLDEKLKQQELRERDLLEEKMRVRQMLVAGTIDRDFFESQIREKEQGERRQRDQLESEMKAWQDRHTVDRNLMEMQTRERELKEIEVRERERQRIDAKEMEIMEELKRRENEMKDQEMHDWKERQMEIGHQRQLLEQNLQGLQSGMDDNSMREQMVARQREMEMFLNNLRQKAAEELKMKSMQLQRDGYQDIEVKQVMMREEAIMDQRIIEELRQRGCNDEDLAKLIGPIQDNNMGQMKNEQGSLQRGQMTDVGIDNRDPDMMDNRMVRHDMVHEREVEDMHDMGEMDRNVRQREMMERQGQSPDRNRMERDGGQSRTEEHFKHGTPRESHFERGMERSDLDSGGEFNQFQTRRDSYEDERETPREEGYRERNRQSWSQNYDQADEMQGRDGSRRSRGRSNEGNRREESERRSRFGR